jgi:hypothetical protein
MMKNWNYEEAKQFVQSIDDDVTRNLAEFFLNRLLVLRTRGNAEPEADFDLLFYVKMVSEISSHHELLRRFLDGVPIESGWDGLEEVFMEEAASEKR